MKGILGRKIGMPDASHLVNQQMTGNRHLTNLSPGRSVAS